MNKKPDIVPDNYDFMQNKSQARSIIKDIYGSEKNLSAKIMYDKLEKCKTIADIDNLLIWGRINLL